jgi:UDP-N-acetylmuramate dehydrogenase
MHTVRQDRLGINIFDRFLPGEPMRRYTTFETGGPAEYFYEPESIDLLVDALGEARRRGLPVTVIGGGSNVLADDAGVRGLVMATGRLLSVTVVGCVVWADAGVSMSDLALTTARRGLAGIERFYGMPGTVGGAVWMNARCYGAEIADTFREAVLVAREGTIDRYRYRQEDFAYKRSPFQRRSSTIVQVRFDLSEGEPAELEASAYECREDRRAKGHYDAPCAGSVFKNNRAFGAPTGRLLDSIGVRGIAVGGAKVSERHANIIINTGNATSTDIATLISQVEERAFERLGLRLEREVVFVGGDECRVPRLRGIAIAE